MLVLRLVETQSCFWLALKKEKIEVACATEQTGPQGALVSLHLGTRCLRQVSMLAELQLRGAKCLAVNCGYMFPQRKGTLQRYPQKASLGKPTQPEILMPYSSNGCLIDRYF